MHPAAYAFDFDALRALSRLGPRATLARVEKWARSQGIAYRYDGSGGIWTTAAALDRAIGVGTCDTGDDKVQASVI